MIRNAITILFLITAANSAAAKDLDKDKPVRPKLFEDVVSCQAIKEPTARLSCYDTHVKLLDNAERSEEIVLSDKASIKEARKGLFGFDIPKIKIFGSDDANNVSEIEVIIASAYANNNGRWTIVFEDGARWIQTETESVNRDPKRGMKAKIRKAAMGSYFVNVGGQRAIRMRRIN